MGRQRELVERLDTARAEHALVRIHRAHGMARLEGYVVGLGERWLLLARLADGLWLRGWAAVRLEDLTAVHRQDDAAFVEGALRLRAQWPPGGPALEPDLSSTDGLLASVQAHGALVGVRAEREDPDARLVGVVRRVGGRRVRVLEVGPDARWRPTPTRLPLAAVTRVDVGGGYEAALGSAAGPPPA